VVATKLSFDIRTPAAADNGSLTASSTQKR
jgi:hypothetical protein